jgi:RNA polymerase sigma-70 factor (ECF subfamily)
MESETGDVTELLHAWSAGDRSVEQQLFAIVLPDLHRLASRMMSGERQDHSLQATALMNEAYCRLVNARERDWENRKHFFAVAARAMRHLLIDHARARCKGVKVALDDLENVLRGRDAQLEVGLAINDLLDKMERKNPGWVSIVEMKFFAGFSDEEVAEALGLSLRSMQRRFGDARRWLYQRLAS